MKNIPYLKLIHMAGLLALLLGVFDAALIYVRQGDEAYHGEVLRWEVSGRTMIPIYASDSKSFQAASELSGGKAMQAVTDFRAWLRSLAYGKRKAYTIVVVCSVFCFLCFWVPDYLNYK